MSESKEPTESIPSVSGTGEGVVRHAAGTSAQDEASNRGNASTQGDAPAIVTAPAQNDGPVQAKASAQDDIPAAGTPDASKESERVTRMGTGSIPKLVLEFAVPAILGMVVNGTYQIIDSVFLGHGVGELGLTAVTVASPIMTVFMALALLIGGGGNALAALRLGEGKHDEAENILGNTAVLGVLASFTMAVLTHIPAFMEALLTLSSATDSVRPYAREFIQILSLGCVFQIVGLGLNNFIRTTGAPNRAFMTMLIGAVGCTLFNAIFVLGMGLGVAGSALATICGMFISCLTVIWYFTRTPNVAIRLRVKYLPLKGRLVGRILTLGTASFAVQIGSAVSMLVTNYALARYGATDPIGADGALAAVGVVGRVAMFSILPLIGMSTAIQPLLGFNYGARLWRRVRTILCVGVAGATAIGTVIWIGIMVFAPQIIGFFGISEESLVDLASFALRVNLILLPVIGFQVVGSNYFQATGQPAKSIILSLTRQILFLIPLTLIFPEILPQFIPFLDALDAVYFAVPTSDFLAIFTVSIFVFIEMRKIGRRIAKESSPAKA